MNLQLVLSVLTAAVPSRLGQLGILCAELERQIGAFPVEHLVLLDNKKRTVGEKRDALLRAARGDYVTFVDDDDWIAPDYISSLVAAFGVHASACPPDVITFRQCATVNGLEAEIEFKLGNPNDPFPLNPCRVDAQRLYADQSTNPSPLIRRNAWHICAWRRSLAMLSHFPALNYGEDWAFASPLCALPGLKEQHIPRVLHFYRHDIRTTEAPPPTA